tara:strand:+ start:106 stop:282 length:177 start_codon:yes stop_codon:yes gene_type:complete
MPCCESEEMAALNCCGKIMYCGCDFCPEQVSCCCYPAIHKCCGAAEAGGPPAEVEMSR